MKLFTFAVAVFNAILAVFPMTAQSAEPEKLDIFISGQDGYHTYRIPSVIVTTKGTVLAFCEGRKSGGTDTGDIDLMLKRSTDGGRTFGLQQVVWDDAANTCGNPCPVVDRTTGTIWLLMTHNLGTDSETAINNRTAKGTRTVWVSQSNDDGATWTKPVDITPSTKKPEWTWYATGPGAGIQLKGGRLVIPCDHRDNGEFSHVIYSDDHGTTWQTGGVAQGGGNECEVVELSDGKLLLNMRNYRPRRSSRAIAISEDQGQTWAPAPRDPVLIEPTCQASIRRYSWPGEGKSRILFSNPASTTVRENLTIRLSYDEGKTWPLSKVLQTGPAAYSCLASLPEGTVLCLYETGPKNPYQKITLARFSLNWLSDGQEP